MVDLEKTTEVLILTSHYRVNGRIALVPGARLTDYVDESKEFFAVLDASVHQRSDEKVLFRAKFLDVNRDSVEIILPAEMIADRDPEGG
jgi:hypothetical protein